MNEIPLYGKVEGVLASEIARGDLTPGDRLPSEDQLLERFGVSRITVRRAIQNLIQRGMVEIRRGHGTYVLAPKISQELTRLTGFVEDMAAHGRKASARDLSQDVVAADSTVARQLGISKQSRRSQGKNDFIILEFVDMSINSVLSTLLPAASARR
jgi:GntR family transcriptional regulator